MYSSFVSLDKFVRYLILFVTIVNGIDSLISLCDFSLLVYRNASDFYVLVLYPPLPILIHLSTSQEEGPHQELNVDLGLPASGTVRKSWLLFKPPNL